MTQPLPSPSEPTSSGSNEEKDNNSAQVLTVLSILVGILTVVVTALGLPKFRLAVFAIALIATLPAIVRWMFPDVRKWRYWDITLIFALVIALATAGVAIAEKGTGKRTTGSQVQQTTQAVGPLPSGGSKHPTAPNSTVPATQSTHPVCTQKLTITSPRKGAVIADGTKGVVITGQACDLGSYSGWLFELDSQDSYYYADYNTAMPAPIVSTGSNGNWSFDDSPIGDSGDSGKLYTLTLVLASPACDKILRSTTSIDGDYKIQAFPSGCEVESSVNIYVTSP